MEEIWKDIKGYEGLYQVSNIGNVKSFKHKKEGKILKRGIDKDGYYQYILCKNGKKKNAREHRLVAEAFIENPDNLSQINHKDENKQNNNIDNLEWCDVSYNNSYGERLNRVSKSNKRCKKVYQYSLDNIFIKEWDNTRFAILGNDFNNYTSKIYSKKRAICQCCEGKHKTAYGYIWKYEKTK